MADEENKSQDQTPAEAAKAEPAGTESGAELKAKPETAPTPQESLPATQPLDMEKLAQKSVAEKPAAEKPVVEKPAAKAPAADKPASADKPAVEKPAAAAKPAGEKPAAGDKPAAAAKPPAAAKPAGAEGAAKKPAARAVATMPTVEIKDDPLINNLKTKFGGAIQEAMEVNGQQVLRVDKARAHEILLYLRDEAAPQFDMLSDLTATHTPDNKERPFDIIYQIYSISATRRLRVKTGLADGEAIESACDIWSTGNWMEREVFDLFGVRFTNHPDLRRILLPNGWVGHPLRKEYPLEYQDNEWVAQNLKIRDLPEDWDYSGKFE
jgi:NADH-quinone oxidoreductase subunit C